MTKYWGTRDIVSPCPKAGETCLSVQCHISYEAHEAWASGPLQSRGPQHESWH